MVCPLDRAGDLEQWLRDRDLTHCTDCDNEIPEARRALGGVTRCVPCQSLFERAR